MFVAKWYTRASRVRIVIAKFDGRWKLPGGPYPIPELVALVTGILATLFLLPRVGQPVLTGAFGIAATAAAVAAMRTMPYSPVGFSTRVHRILRLYTAPVSLSTHPDAHPLSGVSTVRPQIAVLNPTREPAPAEARRVRGAAGPEVDLDRWTDLFGVPGPSATADLFR